MLRLPNPLHRTGQRCPHIVGGLPFHLRGNCFQRSESQVRLNVLVPRHRIDHLDQVVSQKAGGDTLGQSVCARSASAHHFCSSFMPGFDLVWRRARRGWTGRRPNAAANASNTFGMSSGRARRSAVMVTMMTVTARTSTGSCIQNTVQPLFPTAAEMALTDMNTFQRRRKAPDEDSPGALPMT